MALVDSTMHVPQPSRAAGYADVLQALTGACLAVFMVCHALFVASHLLGTRLFDGLAYAFEATYMAQIGGPVVAVGFLAHFALAVRKIPFRLQELKTAWTHARMLRHLDTWAWVLQAATAMVILVLASIHMWVILSDLPITAAEGAVRVQNGLWLLFYLLLLPSVWIHTGVGAYRVLVKWGFVQARDRQRAQDVAKYAIAGFIALGLVSILSFALMSH